jgi:hypothetical protein
VDARGKRVRVSDFYSFTARLYTTDESVYAEYGFRQPDVYAGIVAESRADWMVINAPDLSALEEGIMYCRYHLKAVNGRFDDVMFDRIVKEQLNIILAE